MKKNTFKYIIYVVLISLLAYSCSDNDDFGGGDNFITSFALNVGDQENIASLEGETIIISVEPSLSLEGAQVNYVLSENATIYPDPASYTHWDEEAVFVVKSHNGAARTYKYTVKHTESPIEGNVTLKTQADVDAFLTNGVTKISGSLIIGKTSGKDSIFTLSPLHNLREIDYNLIINPTYAGKELLGLENLHTLGALITDANLHTLSRVYFPNLKTINLGVTINNYIQSFVCPSLETVEKDISLSFMDSELFNVGLDNLQTVGGNFVVKNANQKEGSRLMAFPQLKSVGGNFSISTQKLALNLPELETCGGEFTLVQSKTETVILPKLKEIKKDLTLAANSSTYIDFSSLERVIGNLTLTNQPASIINFPKLTEIGENLALNKLAINSLVGFQALETVGGSLKFTALNIENLEDLKKLKAVTAIEMTKCGAIKSLDIKQLKLESFTLSDMGEIEIGANSIIETPLVFTNTQPLFEGVTEIRSLKMTWNYSAILFKYTLPGVTKIGRFEASVQKCESFSLPDLQEVEEDFKFTWNSSEFKVLEASKLNRVGGAFTFAVSGSVNQFNLKTFTLPALTYVGANFTIYTHNNTLNEDIEEIKMPALETIEGDLIIRNANMFSMPAYVNNKLLNLDGFSALKQVRGLQITNQKGLKSFAGLKNAFGSIQKEFWTVTGNAYNPSFDDLSAGKWAE